MPTEFYRPTSDLITTVSMSLASCIAFAAPAHAVDRFNAVLPVSYVVASPAWANSTADFYAAAVEPPDEATQLAAFENFAGKMLGEAVEPPQMIVDLLNERFWDLI